MMITGSVSEQIEPEQHRFVIGIFADDLGFDQTATLDQVDDAGQLAELAFEIEAVVFGSDEQHVTFALVERLNECFDINVVHAKCFCHK